MMKLKMNKPVKGMVASGSLALNLVAHMARCCPEAKLMVLPALVHRLSRGTQDCRAGSQQRVSAMREGLQGTAFAVLAVHYKVRIPSSSLCSHLYTNHCMQMVSAGLPAPHMLSLCCAWPSHRTVLNASDVSMLLGKKEEDASSFLTSW